MKRTLLYGALFLLSAGSRAADTTFVNWSFSQSRTSDSVVLLDIRAAVAPAVKLYPLQKQAATPLFSTLSFDSACTGYLSGPVAESGGLHTGWDSAMHMALDYFSDSLHWQQKIRAGLNDSFALSCSISYLFRSGDNYIPAEKRLRVLFRPERKTAPAGLASRPAWWIFFAAFAGGILALFTPCVYSMIPVTVSFFTKRSETKAAGVRNALWYAASIIVIFTVLGFLVTLLFGPGALNRLATHWAANLLFFVLFILFGLSFLGAFEMTLPASWTNHSGSKAGAGNLAGIFFMALTLVLVSFSCTGPIIGNLLVMASRGSYWGPLIGMLGFSLALALPFALFAFFPGKLNVLGRAGGWLNAVKVTLGFLELALALKFLSNADLSKGWRILDREVFISLWVVIFALLGAYLLGKIKLHHDDELPKNDFGLPYISVTRLMMALAALGFAVYMVPGLWGAPLKGISAFLPPMGTQDLRPVGAVPVSAGPHPVKYLEQMKPNEPEVVTRYGMVTYFDYGEALAAAKALHKPLLLDFTGINCVNCRKMEAGVWSDPAVMKMLREDFVIASLYVDAQQVYLQEEEQYFSKALEKKVETLGDRNTDLAVSRFGANTQPYYFFLGNDGEQLLPEGYGYDPSVEKFTALLQKVKQAYKN